MRRVLAALLLALLPLAAAHGGHSAVEATRLLYDHEIVTGLAPESWAIVTGTFSNHASQVAQQVRVMVWFTARTDAEHYTGPRESRPVDTVLYLADLAPGESRAERIVIPAAPAAFLKLQVESSVSAPIAYNVANGETRVR